MFLDPSRNIERDSLLLRPRVSCDPAHILPIDRQIHFSPFIRRSDGQVEGRFGQLEYSGGTRRSGLVDSQRVMKTFTEWHRNAW
jgi:hypothetical protein